MFCWPTGKSNALILVIAFALLVLSMPLNASGQTTQDILMEDVTVDVELSETGKSRVAFSASITNRRETSLSVFDIRVDIRELEIELVTIDDVNASATIIAESNYALIRVSPETSLSAHSSYFFEIYYTTEILQESVGVCNERNLCLENALFYVRPLNEFRNFTFMMALPPHSILDERSSPLFPQPTMNYTDGSRLIFVWQTELILPGQEQVFIVKYGLPHVQPAVMDDSMNTMLLVILAGFSGAAIIIVVQRLPNLIRAARVPRVILNQGMTDHEQQVIQILTRKGGSCPQRDIYDDLGMSQSLASMVLTGLEQRGIIRRFREGRENIIHLVEE